MYITFNIAPNEKYRFWSVQSLLHTLWRKGSGISYLGTSCEVLNPKRNKKVITATRGFPIYCRRRRRRRQTSRPATSRRGYNYFPITRSIAYRTAFTSAGNRMGGLA